MTRHPRIPAFLTLVLFCTVAHAQNAEDPDAPGFALTVYSSADPETFDPMILPPSQYGDDEYGFGNLPGFGVVREVRPVDLKAGENTLRFTGVAAGIDPTTVSFDPLGADGDAALLEQNYEYDLIGADKLLQGHVGHEIVVTMRPSPAKRDPNADPNAPARPDVADADDGGGAGGRVVGKLLSYSRDTLVVESADRRSPVRLLSRGAVTSVGLSGRDQTLVTEPTLVWKLHADKAGRQNARVSYQTDGLTWRADYRVTVNDDQSKADLSAWVSLVNQSGIGYPDARLKLIAGDVNRSARGHQRRRGSGLFGGGGDDDNRGFVEKSFFEYHLYTLGRRTSVPNNATKQVELFPPRRNLPVTTTYVYDGAPYPALWESRRQDRGPDDDDKYNRKVDVNVELTNVKANGLGLPLPAGRVRAYKRDDADGLDEFVGEDTVGHTPVDERLELRVGAAFDLVGEWKKTEENLNQFERFRVASYAIKVRNHKQQAVRVLVREDVGFRGKWEITDASGKWEKRDADTIVFPTDVPAGGEATVTYTVKQRW